MKAAAAVALLALFLCGECVCPWMAVHAHTMTTAWSAHIMLAELLVRFLMPES